VFVEFLVGRLAAGRWSCRLTEFASPTGGIERRNYDTMSSLLIAMGWGRPEP
jgi:hypothetical protein